jgi:hypothetical protein
MAAIGFNRWVFNQFAYRDKKVVGVFVRFSCAASLLVDVRLYP